LPYYRRAITHSSIALPFNYQAQMLIFVFHVKQSSLQHFLWTCDDFGFVTTEVKAK